MNGTPLPSPVAKSATDIQQLQLLHQIQAHAMSTAQGPLLLIMFLPLSIGWRLAIYNFFSHFPLPHLSPIVLTVIVLAGPIITLTLLYFAIKMILKTTKVAIPLILKRFAKNTSEKKYLELTFPSDTSKSAYATEQLYTLLHTLARRIDGFLGSMIGQGKEYSLEIVASKNEGIRFILATPAKSADIIKRSLLSFLPGLKIKDIEDYLTNVSAINTETEKGSERVGVVEFALSSDFVLPLQSLKALSEHDSISYLTGAMTKLDASELISCQIVTTPVLKGSHNKAISHMQRLQYNMRRGLPIEPLLTSGSTLHVPSFILFVLSPFVWSFVQAFKFALSMPALIIDNGKSALILQSDPKVDQQALLNPYEQELQRVVKEKIGQHLFETSIRMLIVAKDKEELEARAEGLYASFGPFTSAYQGLGAKAMFPRSFVSKKRLLLFKQRAISRGLFAGQNPILSTSEISDIFHFPYTDTTKTEGLIKSKSQDLPAPLSFKKSLTHLAVVVGKNTYGGEDTLVGLTEEQHRSHMYIVGKTGMGKTTGVIEPMVLADITAGKGVAVVDAHGDMAEHILALIPKSRRKDVVYFNPADKEFPMGLNILSPGIAFADIEEGHERIAASLLSVFQKITPKDRWGQRLEHILRSATLTALLIPTPSEATPYISLFTIQKLLTDASYRNQIIPTIKDPVLKQFWKKEFKLYGSMQQADVISPVTNKLGEFITGKMSRHILLQEESSINIAKIMNEGKIFIANVSKGKLGEERSAFFGTIITALFQLAAYQRVEIPEGKRRDFFLYVDEFQNFATEHFADMFSEAKKFHFYITISHQNFAQIDSSKIVKVTLGNSATMLALKGGPDDEAFLLPYMEPEVEKGQIINLAPHHFFMKVTTDTSEDAFTAETMPVTQKGSSKVKDEILAYSRKHYATPRAMVEKQLARLFGQQEEKGKETANKTDKTNDKSSENIEVKSQQKHGKIGQKHGFRQ